MRTICAAVHGRPSSKRALRTRLDRVEAQRAKTDLSTRRNPTETGPDARQSAPRVPRPAWHGCFSGARAACTSGWRSEPVRAIADVAGCRNASLVRARLLRRGQGHAGAVGAAAASGDGRAVSLQPQSDV